MKGMRMSAAAAVLGLGLASLLLPSASLAQTGEATPPAAAGSDTPGAAGGTAAASEEPRTVLASDPGSLQNLLRGFGSAILEEDGVGDPLITGRIEGQSYRLFFYGCTDGENCTSVQFWTYWDLAPDMANVNDFNRDTRFGKAFRDDDDDLVLQLDLQMLGGMTVAGFERAAMNWAELMSKAAAEIEAEAP